MNIRGASCYIVPCSLLWMALNVAAALADGRPVERVSPAPEVNPNAVVWRTPEPPADPRAGDVWVNPRDGMDMVYVPPGEFILGTGDAELDAWLKEHPEYERESFADEQPQCRVDLPGYWIGRTEVTNAQYLRFVQATGHDAPDHWQGGEVPSGLEDFPVVSVIRDDGRAYAEWAGGRLPSELEWEKAARGADGRLFPWGSDWDSKRCRNFGLITGKTYVSEAASLSATVAWLESHDPFRHGPAAVGSYPAGDSPYGCADMAGNVWEWCAGWYDEKAHQRHARGDLAPPASGAYKPLRGGSWLVHPPLLFRCAEGGLTHPADRYHYYGSFGFRCARGAE
ncbi:MAG: SUMF1/EgtB/PvdO family nonheme iron enzyme [Armatimonadota bacterium]|nr:MAG: SUMF1/EgtB/PvdO family nonheme iron enzyme [Armatimonadota bacterium]